ncbi:hypothetical protein SAMN04487950_3606 [Halogranum rubrum]|uniref:Uncharacterized protein n=1 Tax=Halogranum rubrum TaxID=553466 RepID=A0A1I4HA98_9EURY|nr:hypothetical protein [Halogranum rubrum]SFL39198.1 hypothetical protein SAMN04487950_3606 [Halogranum rubrum]
MKGVNSRHRLVWAGICCYLLVTLALVGPAHVASATQTEEQIDATPNVKFVNVYINGTTKLWPYTSREKDFSTLTLPINVVFHEDADTVRRLFVASNEDSDSQWTTKTPSNETVILNGTSTRWSESDGATRYTYVETESGGVWKDETYQLHDGSYFGTRYHLRLYEGGTPTKRWTAVQAHHEHWDWFRLRHTVNSLAEAQRHVERDFYGTRYLGAIERQRYGNGGIMDTDGWVTVIDLVDWTVGGPQFFVLPVLGLLAAVTDRLGSVRDVLEDSELSHRLSSSHVTLFLTMASLPFTVRLVSIALEQQTPLGDSPKVIAAICFPILAFGLPILASYLGYTLRADDGFVVAAIGLGVGFLLDYSALQITTLPIAVVVHRVTLLLAIGLIAAGGVRWSDDVVTRHGYTLAGATLWVGALCWSLLGF